MPVGAFTATPASRVGFTARMRRPLSVIAGTALLTAAVPASADAAARLVIKGRGYGHGIGMSQYGAYGYATHGFGYREILSRYYTGTSVSPLAVSPDVRVLLQGGRRAVFTGAVAAGSRKLSPRRTYSVVTAAGRVALRSPTGRRLATFDAPL